MDNKKYVKLSTIFFITAIMGVGITAGYGILATTTTTNVNAQVIQTNTTEPDKEPTIIIPEGGTIDVYDKSFESYVGLAIAIISLIATYLVRTGANKKYVDTLYQAKDVAEMIRQDRETRRQGMQVVYEMLPEKAAEIVDRPRVRLQELDKDIGEAIGKVNSLENIIDKFGTKKSKPPL